MSEQRYCLIKNEDCNWFVCPVERMDEANKAFQSIIAYWNRNHADIDGDDECPETPDFVEAVCDDPSNVHFTGYVIR